MSYIKFNAVLDELDSILRSNEKRAEEITDDNVLSANIRELEGEGKKIPKKKQLEHAAKTDQGTPSETDDDTKSVDYQVSDKNNLENEAEKSAKLGNKILTDLYRMLGKTAQNEENEENEETEEELKTEEAEELPEEILNELPEPTEEDAEVLDAIGAKTASDAAIYLLAKKAGNNFADEIMATILNQPTVNSLIEKQASYLTGLKLAELEQIGSIIPMEKSASFGHAYYMKGYQDALNGLPANPY